MELKKTTEAQKAFKKLVQHLDEDITSYISDLQNDYERFYNMREDEELPESELEPFKDDVESSLYQVTNFINFLEDEKTKQLILDYIEDTFSMTLEDIGSEVGIY